MAWDRPRSAAGVARCTPADTGSRAPPPDPHLAHEVPGRDPCPGVGDHDAAAVVRLGVRLSPWPSTLTTRLTRPTVSSPARNTGAVVSGCHRWRTAVRIRVSSSPMPKGVVTSAAAPWSRAATPSVSCARTETTTIGTADPPSARAVIRPRRERRGGGARQARPAANRRSSACLRSSGSLSEPPTGEKISETGPKKDRCQGEEEQIEHGARLRETPRMRSCAHIHSASEIKTALKDGPKASRFHKKTLRTSAGVVSADRLSGCERLALVPMWS